MKMWSGIATIILTAGVSIQPAFSQDMNRDQQRVHQEDQPPSKQVKQNQDRKQVYGSDLMTEQERNEHQEKLRNMESGKEREAYRAQHHEEMQQRAREQGVELPDDVPRINQGKDKGQGAGYNNAAPAMRGRHGGGSGGGKGK